MASLSILTLHGLLLFVGAELIFSLTPGPTVMLISAYGFKGGFRDALAAIAGTQTGNTLWYVICVTGLGAPIRADDLRPRRLPLRGLVVAAMVVPEPPDTRRERRALVDMITRYIDDVTG